MIAGAKAEQLQEEIVTAFAGVQAQDLMSRPAVSIEAGAGLREARELSARYPLHRLPSHRR